MWIREIIIAGSGVAGSGLAYALLARTIRLYKGGFTRKPSNSISTTSSIRRLYSMKGSGKSKPRKLSVWTKFLNRSRGRVNHVGVVDEWSVADLSKLFLGPRFAHGANSKIYHGLYKEKPVAVKILQPPDDDETGILEALFANQFEREVAVLSKLCHPNVLKFIAACKKPSVYCIITEYLSAGSLRLYLHEHKPRSLALKKLIAMALDIARGMEYIHSQGVVHRDLKPENILIDEEFHLKVADFGTSCEEAFCHSSSDEPAGTYRWMAPEMIKKKKSYGRKVDVYSFGLVLWEMVAGMIPYGDMNPVQVAFAVVNKNSRPVIPSNCPLPLKALIEQCWSRKPKKRPEFRQIVKLLEQFQSSLQPLY